MAACMEKILENFVIDDADVKSYLTSIFDDGVDDFQCAEDVFDAVGPLLESTQPDQADINIEEFCETLYNILRLTSTNNDLMTKLTAPVHIASIEKKREEEMYNESANIWLVKDEKKSQVDQKKLEKAEQKIKQKQSKKDDGVRTKTKSPTQTMEASASQSMNRKDIKSESRGTNKTQDIHIENFDIAFGSKVLFENANLMLSVNRRYGLVGRNGMGKTTLLKMISSGGLSIPSHFKIIHVEQEVVGDETEAIQSVLESDTVREGLLQKEKELQAQISSSEQADPSLSQALSDVYTKLANIDADRAPTRAAIVLNGLGFTTEMQKMKTREFSGGWRMRLALARALFTKPDLLLLDEPTNMLDMRAILWLEQYLESWPTTMLIVSHDRSFLEAVCTDVLHLYNQQLDYYKGSFEQFMATKDELMKNKQREYDAQLEYRKSIQVFIDRFRYNANRAAQVQSKLKLLEKLPKLKPVEKEKPVIMKFPVLDGKLQGTVLRLDEVTFRYQDDLPTIFENVDISAGLDSRICIVGENGSGKTTLLKILTGENEPTKGIRHCHRNLRIGYFSQHHIDQLEMNVNCVELLARRFPGKPEEHYRHQLGSYGVTGDLALRQVSTLSGGQKSRLAFAAMSMTLPNFLILDEPTNHLDMETIEALAAAIKVFKGGVILVSHDERLIDAVCTEMWLCRSRNVKAIEGGLNTYKKLLQEEFNRIGITKS